MITKKMRDYIPELKKEFPMMEEKTIKAIIKEGCYQLHGAVMAGKTVWLSFPKMGINLRIFKQAFGKKK